MADRSLAEIQHPVVVRANKLEFFGVTTLG
jgi:hypothetical protein